MIKIIKISTLVATILLICGIIFKSQHLMGANAIFMAGVAAGVLSAAFMITSFAGKLTSGLEKFSIIFTSIAIAVVLLGFLFKVMHWPGAAKLIWIADIGIAISGVLFLIDGLRDKDPLKSGLKITAMFFMLFLLMLIMVMR